MLIADCWLYILIAISVKGKSVIWKSPEVWARGRLCAQSPRSRRGKQLAAWGLGPCSARKGETAEGPWSHQLSSHTPDFFIVFYFYHSFLFFILIPSIVSPNTCILYYLRGGGFCNCSKCIWHQKLLETVKWIPLREKNKNICNINCPDALRSKVSSEQNNFFHAFYLQTKLEWIWLKKMNSGSSGSSGSSMSIVNVYVFENSALTKMTSTFVLPVLITNVNSVYVSMVWQVGWWQSPPALVAGPQGRLPAKVSQSYPASLVSRALAGLLKVEAMKRL